MGIIAWIVLGLIAGALAKLIMPGRDPGGIIVTMLIGIASAQDKTQSDPGLRLLHALPGAGPQVDATGRLAAIGSELSLAGKSAASITSDVLRLKQAYAGKRLTLADLA